MLTEGTKGRMVMEMNKPVRMRKPVQDISDRQIARCLSDIERDCDIPENVKSRIRRAIAYTAKDVDKINNKESGNGNRSTPRASL